MQYPADYFAGSHSLAIEMILTMSIIECRHCCLASQPLRVSSDHAHNELGDLIVSLVSESHPLSRCIHRAMPSCRCEHSE